MQRKQCPIHKGTPDESDQKCGRKVHSSDNFSSASFKQEMQVPFAENPKMKINSLKKQKY